MNRKEFYEKFSEGSIITVEWWEGSKRCIFASTGNLEDDCECGTVRGLGINAFNEFGVEVFGISANGATVRFATESERAELFTAMSKASVERVDLSNICLGDVYLDNLNRKMIYVGRGMDRRYLFALENSSVVLAFLKDGTMCVSDKTKNYLTTKL